MKRSLLAASVASVASVAAVLGVVAGPSGCAELKRADEPGSVLPDGATPVEEGGATDAGLDVAPPDAGPAPQDFECDGDPWTKATKTKPECAPRQVFVVESTVLLVQGISIAVTPAGRVGISYNAEQGAETGEHHLAHFTPSSPSFTPAIIKRQTAQYFHDGYQSRLAATAPDTLHALTYDVFDADQLGELHIRKLVAGKEPLTDDLVMTSVKSPSEIGFAVDGAGTSYVTARLSTGATTAKLSARRKPAGAAVETLADLDTALLPAEAPGAGASSLFADGAGELHVLLHHNEVMQHSNPRYHTLTGAAWSYRKTVDNAVIDGLSGYSPRLAVFGTKKYAVYFFRKALQTSSPTADLRLATWESSSDVPTVEILDQNIPSDLAQSPRYRVAMAIDKYGLLHLALVRPSPGNDTGYLSYVRQTRVDGGGTKWLTDIVDYDVVDSAGPTPVDIAVDASGRPHIAYRSAVDNKVHYATRFDR